MKDIVRTLGYYGFDDDNTMVKKDENYKDETFEISKVKEIKNMKYVKSDVESNNKDKTQE